MLFTAIQSPESFCRPSIVAFFVDIAIFVDVAIFVDLLDSEQSIVNSCSALHAHNVWLWKKREKLFASWH